MWLWTCVTEHTCDCVVIELKLWSIHTDVLYTEEFRTDMRSAMKSVASAAGSALYSSACFKHCVALSSEFWSVKLNTAYAGQVSFSESLGEWIEHDYHTGVIFDMEDCTGFDCGCVKVKGRSEVA